MSRRRFTPAERAFIIERARRYCEYCRTPLDFSPESFEIEHIIPISRDGSNEMENLALACGGCNIRKSHFIQAVDPVTNDPVNLFNPRTDVWEDHFQWSLDFSLVEGLTPVGRATMLLLGLNRKGLVNLRLALAMYGVHPEGKS